MSASSKSKKQETHADKSGSCQAIIDGEKCGETRKLEILQDIKSTYQSLMQDVDSKAGGDCLKAKLTIQEQWINDLMEQNEMMVKVVEALENVASDRVMMLEEKLRNNAKCMCELEEKEKKMSREVIETKSKSKEVEKALEKKNKEYEEMKRSMIDMRKALTEEVANKHDIICALRRDVQQLEEQCLQADKQVAFRDDIIKELRKEIKQLKQQIYFLERCYKRRSLPEKSHSQLNPSPKKSVELKEGSGTDVSKKDSKCGTPFITINHLKSEQSANSTVIFIHKQDNREKVVKGKADSKAACNDLREPESTPCIGSDKSQKSFQPLVAKHHSDSIFLNRKYEEMIKSNTNRMSSRTDLHACKSENDLSVFEIGQERLKPVKDRSRFTKKILSQLETIDNALCILNGPDLDSDNSRKRIDIPNHIPVKTYVNNIELSKQDTKKNVQKEEQL